MNDRDIQNLDLRHSWHPCAQMKDYEQFEPLVVKRARGSYFELSNGKKIIDGISSWWCKTLGHQHPALKQALLRQIDQFEHVMFANTTNEVVAQLSQRLANLMSGLTKVFYAGDGSCAVEIAMKMSLHAHVLQGHYRKKRFVALSNGYHGETTGALSVSDLGAYREPYQSMLFEPILIKPHYVSGVHDDAWGDATNYWSVVEQKLLPVVDEITAILVEPIVQGAAGMRVYSQDFLTRLSVFAKTHGIHLIADEIMTGVGRTGKMLACEHAGITPDFVCLSKGLTSGWLPFSAVLSSDSIYDVFYDDHRSGKAFLHSHTYSGNVLGASLALETLNIVERDQLCDRATQLNNTMLGYFKDIEAQTGYIKNIRGVGALIAADLDMGSDDQRLGFRLQQAAVDLGAFIRPIGNTLYWLPPLNIKHQTLMELKMITAQALIDVARGAYRQVNVA